MTKDNNQARSRVATARREVAQIRKRADRDGLNLDTLAKMEHVLQNSRVRGRAAQVTGFDPLQQAAMIATHQEEQTVNNWTPADLREMFLAAVSGEWMDGENDGPYSTLLVESWVKSHPKAIDEYHLTLRSGRIVRYRQFRDLLDRGCFAIY